MSDLSKEAIDFQPVSAPTTLASEMTALFQNTIDYRNKIVSSDTERVKLVVEYFTKKIAPKLLSVIEKNTGLQMTIAIPKTLIANFAILMEFEKDKFDSVDTMIEAYSGMQTDNEYKILLNNNTQVCKTAKELIEFSNSLNRNTGRIMAGMMKKHKFKCKLYFDVYAAFLIKETGARACEPATAPEITAVILHEIGHALSFVEHAADMIFRKNVVQMSTEAFIKTASVKEKIKYASYLSQKSFPALHKKLKSITDYIETNDRSDGSLVWSGIRILMDTVLALFNSTAMGICNVLIGTIVELRKATVGGIYNSIVELHDRKTSDFARMPYNDQYCEILADEYVTRFGYGVHLASQLKKLMYWCRLTGLGDMWMKQFNGAFFFGRMLPWVIYTAFFGDKFSSAYPTEMDRYEKLMIDTLKAFKDNNVDEYLLTDYYKSYRQIKAILEHPNGKQRFTTVCNYLHDALKYIAATPHELLFSGRFDREYARLYDQVQYLSNNELYALSYKLKNLNTEV